MRHFDRSVIVSTLALVAAASVLVMACNTTDPGATADDAGAPADETGTTTPPVPLPDGAVPDANVVPAQTCAKAADCPSGVCNLATKLCMAASCKDGVKNAVETDVDCGGDCAKCDALKGCTLAKDCVSGVCLDPDGKGKKCQAPTNTDGVKNGNETGVDCGATGNPTCADGQTCVVRDDCTNKYCKAGVCTAVTPDDGVQNGTETDVDCGGPGAKPCDDNLMCAAGTDCTSMVCMDAGAGLRCQPPSFTDGVKNGTETDLDCGGNPAYPCATGKSCKVGGDCASLGCDYTFKCAPAPSCAAHYGGDTCGQGGAGGYPGEAAAWESCCTTLPVTTASGGTVYMDKYPATAGRMRVFLESVGYDVRGYVQGARAAGKIPVIPINANTSTPAIDGVHPVLDPTWDAYLPVSFAGNQNAGELSEGTQNCTGANGGPPCSEGPAQAGVYTGISSHLGGTIFRNNSQSSTGCYVGSPGTHSFRFPAGAQDGSPPEQSQDVYDTKTLQCVDYLVAQAFCVWDGGRLETFQEWQTAYGGSATPWAPADTRTPVSIGSASYWGCRFPWATDADQNGCATKWGPGIDNRSNELADYQYSYEYPKLGSVDYIVFLTAPGRTKGRGPLGHSDLLGAGFELTSSVTWQAGVPGNRDSGVFAARHRWTGNGSWEVHGYSRTYTGTSMLLNKYGKLGLRCVKFAPN